MGNGFKNFKELNGCVVIYADNYLNDIEGEKLEDACDAFLKRGENKIVIDFTYTELVNSIGISILVGIMEKFKDNRGVLFFSGLKKVNYDIFNVLGLAKYVSIFQTEEEAVEKMAADQL